MKYNALILLATMFLLVACKSTFISGGTAPEAAHKNVYYTQTQAKHQALDIYLPRKVKDPLPVVIYMHGGGYLVGEKEEVAQRGNPVGKLAQQILDNNMALVSVNYRLLPDYSYPSQTDDVLNAIKYIRDNARKYGLDTAHMALMGGSAGGHLAQYASNMLGKNKIRATVSYFAPTDFTAPDTYADPSADCKNIDLTKLMQLLGVKIPDNFVMHESLLGEKTGTPAYLAKAKAISPLYLATANTPPILILHGTKDCLVPISFSYAYQNVLQQHHVPQELIIVEGVGHGDPKFFSADYNEKVISFLNKYLK